MKPDLLTKKPRKKKCKICPDKFMPRTTTQVVCSVPCSIEHARRKREQKERRVWRERKRALKTIPDLLKEVQIVFNRFIRLRDKDKPCISCGREPNDNNLITGSRWDCGHYRSVGACPELRFEELNAHKQCVYCNKNRSGNVVEYRLNLIGRIGPEKLEWLESKHPAKHYTREQLIELKKYYQVKCRELSKCSE